MAESSRTLGSAEQRITDLGLPLPGKPGRSPDTVEWPDNVATLGPEEIAEHMTWWIGWAGHARYQLARIETDLEAFEAEYALERQTRIFKSKGDYATVTELKAAIDQAPDMAKMQAKILQAQATKKLLRALVASYEEKNSTISREISRRGAERQESDSGSGSRFTA